jgi:hypothetical protein
VESKKDIGVDLMVANSLEGDFMFVPALRR